jgi:hypothetical protein
MGDSIAKYGIFSGIGVAVVTAGVTLTARRLRRGRPTLQSRPFPIRPLDVEVIALWFEVSLSQQIPEVRVWVQFVNYLNRELRLSDVTASYCHINQGPPLENIPAVEYRVPPRQSWQILCRRTLLDAESKVLLAIPWNDQFSAHLNMRLRDTAGRKAIALDPGAPTFAGRSPVFDSHYSVSLAERVRETYTHRSALRT